MTTSKANEKFSCTYEFEIKETLHIIPWTCPRGMRTCMRAKPDSRETCPVLFSFYKGSTFSPGHAKWPMDDAVP